MQLGWKTKFKLTIIDVVSRSGILLHINRSRFYSRRLKMSHKPLLTWDLIKRSFLKMPGRGLKRNSKNKKGKIGNYLTEHLRENVSQNERVKFLSRLLFPR